MFTGIAEEIGKIKSFSRESSGAYLGVECRKIPDDVKIGDSIAVNGCCQTVVGFDDNVFFANVSEETLAVTNFSDLKPGDFVNLERALTLNSRLGGHIVSGHVDCVGKLVSKVQAGNFYDMEFSVPAEFQKYIIKKGSITVNGVSLTVANISGNNVKIAVIPETYGKTNLQYLNIGDGVNIETDILGKYVEKMLSVNDNKSNISMEFLKENGFV